MKFKLKIIKTFVFIIALFIFILGIFLTLSALYVRTLPEVDDIQIFALKYQGKTKDEAVLEEKCVPFAMMCVNEALYIPSTIFPYSRLNIKYVKGAYIRGVINRYTYIDSFWNVFWIQIQEEPYGESKFYGPFRYKNIPSKGA